MPDDVWDEAAKHYDEKQLAALVVPRLRHERLEPPQRGDPTGGRLGLVSMLRR